jgi:hypothetical protein
LIAAVQVLPAIPTAMAHLCSVSSLTSTIDAAELGNIAPDQPSSMADFAGIAASHEANILAIHHGSPFTSAQYRETAFIVTSALT